MKKFDELLKVIYQNENWKNENEFLINVLFSSSVQLIKKAHEEIECGETFITVPMLLRQIQENIVVLLGLLSSSYTIEDFIKKGNDPIKIMNDIKLSDEKIDNNNFEMLNEYLKRIKSLLNDYSHTSFDGAMSLFTERFQTFETKQFNKSSLLILVLYIEGPLLALLNEYYKQKYELPKGQTIVNEFKKIKTLKYATKNMPEKVKTFIKESEYLSSYYSNRDKEFKKTINEFKNYEMKNKSE